MQCSAVQCSAVQWAPTCVWEHCSPHDSSSLALCRNTELCTVQCSAVSCSVIQCSEGLTIQTVKYSMKFVTAWPHCFPPRGIPHIFKHIQNSSTYTTALHCTALYFTLLHCTAMHCTIHCPICVASRSTVTNPRVRGQGLVGIIFSSAWTFSVCPTFPA